MSASIYFCTSKRQENDKMTFIRATILLLTSKALFNITHLTGGRENDIKVTASYQHTVFTSSN